MPVSEGAKAYPTCPLLPCPPSGAGCPRFFLLGARWTQKRPLGGAQAMEYESMCDICKESLHYCCSLTLDVVSFLIVEELGGALHYPKDRQVE